MDYWHEMFRNTRSDKMHQKRYTVTNVKLEYLHSIPLVIVFGRGGYRKLLISDNRYSKTLKYAEN